MSLLRKDKHVRHKVHLGEMRHVVLKKIQYNQSLPLNVRVGAQMKLNSANSSSPTKVRNRCVLSSRPRGVLRFVKVSRIQFRHFSLFGFFPGVHKLSW
uniref:Ribosomal protein S14 n=1 Tax=Ophirina amphinema TaxID=2108040 RepID=A0A348AYR6_9EUKA|nr:ribosomal protein S14 [Ophirina amphinema]